HLCCGPFSRTSAPSQTILRRRTGGLAVRDCRRRQTRNIVPRDGRRRRRETTDQDFGAPIWRLALRATTRRDNRFSARLRVRLELRALLRCSSPSPFQNPKLARDANSSRLFARWPADFPEGLLRTSVRPILCMPAV